MKYTVRLEGKHYPEHTIHTFTNKQEAKDFFRAEQNKPSYNGGTAYDENFISIFADEFDSKIPSMYFDKKNQTIV